MSTKKYNAAWLLFILAIILACTDARGQVANVQINPNTGVLKSPATGAFPGIQPSQSVTRTTDANYSVPVGVSLIEWNATTQSAQRSITLPDITPVANGSIPAGSLITVKIVSANSQNVNVLDFDANSLVIITTGALYQFRAEADGDWQATNMSFGTAAYVADAALMHLAGTETVTGNKTFSAAITASSGVTDASGNLTLSAPSTGGQNVTLTVGEGSGYVGTRVGVSTIDLVDYAFQPSVGLLSTIRLEHRVAQLNAAGNSAGEFQLYADTNGGAGAAFYTGAAETGVKLGKFVARGTPTNDSAAAGYIGEVISSTVASGSAVSLTTGTPANVTSISLTAGDYDISGSVYFVQGASTLSTYYTGGIGAVSATLPGYAGAQESIPGTAAVITGYDPSVGIPPTRVSIASTTTYYLVAQSAFTISTNAAYGHLRARRMR